MVKVLTKMIPDKIELVDLVMGTLLTVPTGEFIFREHFRSAIQEIGKENVNGLFYPRCDGSPEHSTNYDLVFTALNFSRSLEYNCSYRGVRIAPEKRKLWIDMMKDDYGLNFMEDVQPFASAVLEQMNRYDTVKEVFVEL